MNSVANKKCPVCDIETLASDIDYSICPICMWEDDPIQTSDPDLWGGANSLSLNDYKARWVTEHKRIVPYKREKASA
jgi:hypothetical protein